MNPIISRLLARTTLAEDPYMLLDLAGAIDPKELGAEICKMPYGEFLETLYWQSVSISVKERANNRCQVCNSPYNLEAHHRTYDIHGKEHLFLGDITCLDRSCHSLFHQSKKKVVVTRVSKTSLPKAKRSRGFFRRAAIKLMIRAETLEQMGRNEVKRLLRERGCTRDAKRKAKKEERRKRKEQRLGFWASLPVIAT